LFVGGDLRGSGLHLQDELDALDRSDGGLRHGSGNTAGHEVLRKTDKVFGRLGFGHCEVVEKVVKVLCEK